MRPPAEASDHVLDRYVLAKTRQLVEETTAAMDAYDLFGACARVRSFVDVLTNWYIRRSRQRFWDGDHDAIDTLHTVLDVRRAGRRAAAAVRHRGDPRRAAPRRRRRATSVHLADWPTPAELPADDELVAAMDEVRDVCSATLSVRKAHGRRVRQPLATLTVAVPDADAAGARSPTSSPTRSTCATSTLTDDVGAVAGQVLQVVPAALGPRLGRHTQDVIRAVKAGDWTPRGRRASSPAGTGWSRGSSR